ncbi:MAG: biotin carboxylase N-terminal domain-containing protein [Burkholderiaceae bacterium]
MFRKILIANRGEIACRIARTCERMGIAIATVHSDADRDAMHVGRIGESVAIGPAPARQSYLDVDRVVLAAERVGADAVHPGYGFLSENAEFAEALHARGIAFIGPSPDVLRGFGDKAQAKCLALAAGVPVIPGPAQASRDPARIAALAGEIGYPVMLKAAAGGGGKGIRVVRAHQTLADDIGAAMREGLNAFGDDAVLVEKHLADGRHVEVQILGDGAGKVIHLWDRECSLQRRHQKVVEEAPALPLPDSMRSRMLEAAVALGRHVRYRALGTVEFLVTGDVFHFLEVNPRLQVEHPVTEAVTGLDLVELQIRAAAGAGIALSQAEVRCEGHAIEARLYAEDPDAGFMPSTGRLHRLHLPGAPARVETGVRAGDAITPHYDPMIAKLITAARSRAEAIASMRTALAATRLAGPANNLAFLDALFRSPAVVDATPDTTTIDALLPELTPGPPAWRRHVAAVAAALAFGIDRRAGADAPASAWPAFTHWRLGENTGHLPSRPHFSIRVDIGPTTGMDPAASEVLATVGTAPAPDGAISMSYRVRIGDTVTEVGLEPASDPASPDRITIDGVGACLWHGFAGDRIWLSDGHVQAGARIRPALHSQAGGDGGKGSEVLAPLTGKVLEVRVTDGEPVNEHQVLIVIESMKMELRIAAPSEGVARGVSVAVGDMVERGAVLARVEVASEPGKQ